MTSETRVLFRPVGPIELKLIEESEWTKFPPRLEWQPIFYPVLNEAYARQIAGRWNVAEQGSGFVTRFEVDTDYLRRYPVRRAGAAIHEELWVPAEDLEEFNRHIVGPIKVIASYGVRPKGEQ
jgi:hypothetical protein